MGKTLESNLEILEHQTGSGSDYRPTLVDPSPEEVEKAKAKWGDVLVIRIVPPEEQPKGKQD